jgi:hypothetical protein
MPLGAFKLNGISRYLAPAVVSWPTNRYNGEIQVTGAAVLNTTNKKFGTASGNFTSGGYITYKQFNSSGFSSSGNYTIEFWIMLPAAVTGQKTLFTVAGSGGSVSLRPQGGNVYDIEYTFQGENWNTNGGTAQTLTYGTWYHCAIVRYTSGPTTNIFFNGTRRSNRVASHTNPFGTGTSDDLLINSGENLVYLDEIRLSNTSRYANAATYTIPTAAFSNDINTKLLMHMDGTNGDNQFTDDNSVSLVFNSSSVIAGTSATSTTFTTQVNDIVVYFVTANNNATSAAPPALVTPSGWTNVFNIATGTQAAAQRTAVFYQISTVASTRSVTSFTGTQGASHIILVYRPSFVPTTVSFTTGTSEITVNTPANQTLTFDAMSATKVAFAYGANSGTTTTVSQVVTSTVTPSRYLNAAISTSNYARLGAFEGAGFTGSSTISKTDLGTNSMLTTIMTVS